MQHKSCPFINAQNTSNSHFAKRELYHTYIVSYAYAYTKDGFYNACWEI